jgi:hypothetical protein
MKDKCVMGDPMPPPKGMAGDDCDQTSDCATGLACITNICCMASSCDGACLTGACRKNGAGCQPRQDGVDCGSMCSGSSALTSKKCNANGMCVSSTVMCPAGSACADGVCAAAPGAELGQTCGGDVKCKGNAMCLNGRCCKSACDGMCQVPMCDGTGTCQTAADGTPCGGNGRRVCMGGTCMKMTGPPATP